MGSDIKAPRFPESIQDGTVMKWYKAEGEAVQHNEKLVDIETDKVVLEVHAQSSGLLGKILKKAGDVVKSDELIGTLESWVATPLTPVPSAPAAEPPATPAEKTPEPIPAPAPVAPVVSTPPPAPSVPAPAPQAPDRSPTAGPAARHLIQEHGLDPARISGTAKGGRISKMDVVELLSKKQQTAPVASTQATIPPSVPAVASLPSVPAVQPRQSIAKGRPEERVPMSRLRQRIADRLVQAQHSAAMLTTFNEINMQPVMDIRARLKERFETKYRVKLGFMSFFVKAATEALKKFPVINASVENHEIIYHGYYDIGVAVSTERGLVVPVLRDADQRSFADIESSIVDFAKRAADGKLAIEELQGGTFTITNGGVFGSMLSTPIINPPQSAILGMHKIEQRPVAENGQVVIRPIMYLALSYDHRIIDGRDAVQFLVAVKEILEDPSRLLLEI